MPEYARKKRTGLILSFLTVSDNTLFLLSTLILQVCQALFSGLQGLVYRHSRLSPYPQKMPLCPSGGNRLINAPRYGIIFRVVLTGAKPLLTAIGTKGLYRYENYSLRRQLNGLVRNRKFTVEIQDLLSGQTF